MTKELKNIYQLFFEDTPIAAQRIDTGRGDNDFRATFIFDTAEGTKHVLKMADNDFTFPEKIAVWQRTVEEYRKDDFVLDKYVSNLNDIEKCEYLDVHGEKRFMGIKREYTGTDVPRYMGLIYVSEAEGSTHLSVRNVLPK